MHAFGWPQERKSVLEAIAESRLKGMAAYGGVLGLLQIFVQWSCSITMYVIFRHSVIFAVLIVQRRVTVYSQGSTHGKPNGMSTAIQAFLHAAIVVFPAVAITLPKPSSHSWETDVPTALITMTNMVVAPLFNLLQFYVQYREYRRQSGDAGALSLLSLSIQVPVLAMLAIRLFIRLGTPPWIPRHSYGPYFGLWVWDTLQALYSWGMLAINYTIYAIGCVFLLGIYVLNGASRTSGELAPLLA